MLRGDQKSDSSDATMRDCRVKGARHPFRTPTTLLRLFLRKKTGPFPVYNLGKGP